LTVGELLNPLPDTVDEMVGIGLRGTGGRTVAAGGAEGAGAGGAVGARSAVGRGGGGTGFGWCSC
jgi:hypothetical protein